MDPPGDRHQHGDPRAGLQSIGGDTMSDTQALLFLVALMVGIPISMSVPGWAVQVLDALGVK